MATKYSPDLLAYSGTASSSAAIKAWAQFIEDTLVAGGWVVTTDTGQTLPSALVGLTTANTKAGYRIYRMNDPLQATYPVFMRIDYGGGTNVGNSPGIWVTIGTGSNGAGTITGILWNGGSVAAPSVLSGGNSTTQLTNSYGSAGSSRAMIALFIQAASQAYPLVFTIGRTKNSQGQDTGDGLLLVYTGSGGSPNYLDTSRYIVYAGGVQPLAERGLSYILTYQSPTQTFAPGDIGVGIVIHFKGIAQQPGTQILITNSNDVSAEGVIKMILYNATRTYVQLSGLSPYKALSGASASAPDNNARILARFD
jgi:hypothetical protein